MALVLILSLAACTTAQAPDVPNAPKPPMPDKISQFDGDVPIIKVYVGESQSIESMPLEEYLSGVLAGEMKNDWPLEALKAQAILARTFVLRFMSEKESVHQGADISTDIEEAQAYNAADINERVRQAVEETRGMVLASKEEFPYAWFHAHSGGKTALAKEGLGYEKAEPNYTQVTQGNESDQAPENAKTWTATFSDAQILEAAKASGVTGDKIDSIQIGDRGESGRAVTLIINGQQVAAPSFRVALGSMEMRSTLLESIEASNGQVTLSGMGYGHGVGMSQWGAYGMAESGSKAEEIVTHYFKDVQVVKMW